MGMDMEWVYRDIEGFDKTERVGVANELWENGLG